MSDTLIAFVIPAYNSAATVGRAIDSARQQTAPADEIIVVDDGSSDNTAEIAAAAGATVLRQANGGPAAARNAGIGSTTAPWIALLDADDVARPNRLALQRAAMNDARVAAIHGPADGDQRAFDDPPTTLDFETLWRRNRICTSTVLLRRSAWEAVGKFDEARELIGVEDYNLWLRIARAGWQFRWIPQVLTDYQPTPASLSLQSKRFAAAELANAAAVAKSAELDAATLGRKQFDIYREYGLELFHKGDRTTARQFLARAAHLGRLDWKARSRLWAAAVLPDRVTRSS